MYDQQGMRGLNSKNVFTFIAEKGKVSRSEITRTLGSSMTTILKITDSLQEKGLISPCGTMKTTKGRRPQVLEFDPKKVSAFGVDYDGQSVKLGICDYYGNILYAITQSASRDITVFFTKQLPYLVTTTLEKSNFPRESILGIGICMPGEFNATASEFYLNPSCLFKNVETFESVLYDFSQSINFPVYCYNDVNASAFGEYINRGKSVKDLIFILCGEGIGSGMILDGKLRLGERYAAGEIGYFTNDATIQQDFSTPGWFESRLSKEFLQTTFPGYEHGENTSEYIAYVSDMLALITANVCNLLDVGLVVLDGNLIQGDEDLILSLVQKRINNLCLNKVTIEKSICISPSISGATSLVITEEIDSFLHG